MYVYIDCLVLYVYLGCMYVYVWTMDTASELGVV